MYVSSMKEMYQMFMENTFWVVFSLVALLFTIFCLRKDKRLFILILISMGLFAICSCRLCEQVIMKVNPSAKGTFYRLLWALPIIVLDTSAVLLLIKKIRWKCVKVVVFVFVLVLVYRFSLFQNNVLGFSLPDNMAIVSDEIVQLDNLMSSGVEINQITHYLSSSGVYLQLQAYSEFLEFPLSRNVFLDYDNLVTNGNGTCAALFRSLCEGVSASDEEIGNVSSELESLDIEYIVVDKILMIPDYYEKFGYSYFGETDNYVVYKSNIE